MGTHRGDSGCRLSAVGIPRLQAGEGVKLIWGVDIRVTDVETGMNLRQQAAGFKGDYLALKTLGMRQLAREVAGE